MTTLPYYTERPSGFFTKRRLGLVAFIVIAALILEPLYSLGMAYAAPGNDSALERTAAWMRDHHLGGLITEGERVNAKLHPPRVGGTPKGLTNGALPIAAAPTNVTMAPVGNCSGQTADAGSLPTIVKPALPNEGCYSVLDSANGQPAIKVAYMRPDAVHTSYLAGVIWMSNNDLSFKLHPGVTDPGHGPWKTPASISPTTTDQVVAAFNSGFRLTDSQGGYYSEGRTIAPLKTGGASLVVDTGGHISVGQWGRDETMSPSVSSVRQNLVLLVDNGKPVPGIAANANDAWGATVGNKVNVWRSGIGQTANGDVVFVVGPALTAQSLADLLANAGAVRGMELDINQDWTSFISYAQGPTGLVGTNVVTGTYRSPDRYFTDSSRDFYSVTLR